MRIEAKFKQLKKEGRKAFIAYIPFGFPNVKYTESILFTLQDAGVDIIELGIPFSDPLADGPIIQKATSQALRKGATIKKLFAMLGNIEERLKVPVVLMSYCNPVFRFGMTRFFKDMQRFSLSGIIMVDLPVEESAEYIKEARKFNLETVFFITPTTVRDRVKKIVKVSGGFIYYISVTGITGPRRLSLAPVASHIAEVRKGTDLPICVGFGIHRREQVKRISKFSDGVIVGSGFVKFIEEHRRDKDFLAKLGRYVKSLKSSE